MRQDQTGVGLAQSGKLDWLSKAERHRLETGSEPSAEQLEAWRKENGLDRGGLTKFDNASLDAMIMERERPKLHSLDTFTARDLQAREFPPLRFVIPGYVHEGLTLLAGRPKLGKSWLCLDWALAKAYGGVACGSIECEAGDVLYAALEDNQRRLQRRLQMLLPDAQWPDRLEMTTTFRRFNEGGLDDLRAWAASVERPSLAILDTLACVRPLRSGKENNYDSDYAALAPVQSLAGELGIAIIVVHHVRKMDAEDPLDTVSGSTGLTGATDAVLILNRDSQGVTLYGRGRDADEIEVAMSFDKISGRWSIEGNVAEVRRSDERKRILDALRDAGEPIGPKVIAAAAGMPETNVSFLLHKMVSDGEVAKEGRGKYAAC